MSSDMAIKCFVLTPKDDPEGRYWHDGHGNTYHLGTATIDGVPPAPVGAMWNASWFAGLHFGWHKPLDRNPDGLVLTVRTPGGDWIVDGPAFQNGCLYGEGWTRTGVAPDITVTPSIHIPGRYHGWLRNGWLEEC